MTAAGETYAAKLSSFHIVQLEQNPFTVYVVTVRKANSQWRIFRRYKEWEDLRVRLHQWCGSAPNMPGKMLFGRMRPEVIEQRVVGLNQFLQPLLLVWIDCTEKHILPEGAQSIEIHSEPAVMKQAADHF